MGNLGMTEILLIGVALLQEPPIERLGAFPLERFFPEKDRFDLALLLFFGPSKLPELGKSLGKGIQEFKKASKAITEELP